MKKRIVLLKKHLNKWLFVSVLTLIGISNGNAQNITNYAFSTNATSSLGTDLNSNPIDMSVGTTLLMGPSVRDGSGSGLVNFPSNFNFWVMGTRNTQFSVSSNGWLGIGVALTGTGNGWLGGGTAGNPRVAPLLMNTAAAGFVQAMGTSPSGKIHFKLVGIAPNRTMVIEYQNMTISSTVTTSTSVDATFQARLYEASGVIEFVYGNINISGAAPVFGNIGFSNTTTVYQNITPSTQTSSTTVSASVAFPTGAFTALNGGGTPTTRRSYVFTPAAVAAPTSLTFTNNTATSATLNWTNNHVGGINNAVFSSNDGGVSWNFEGTVGPTVNTFALTGLSPSTTYNFRVTTIRESHSLPLTGSITTGVVSLVKSTPTGGNWNNVTTWLGGVLPTLNDSVVIADGATVTVNITNAVCAKLTVGEGTSGTLDYLAGTASTLGVAHSVFINTGGTFTAGTGSLTTHSLNIGSSANSYSPGNLVNNGTFDMSTTAGVTVTFLGRLNGVISGSGSILDFRQITVNKGSVAFNRPTLTIDVPYTVQGATALGLINTHTAGVINVTGSFTMSNRLYVTDAYTIPSNGGLILNNPNFTIASTNGSPTVNGLLRVTQGIYNVLQTNAQVLGFGAGATFIVDGGTINAAARITTGNAITFNFSSGIINVAIVGNNTSASPSFGITSAASIVNWSGGTLNLVNRNTGATILDYHVGPFVAGNANFTGGTLNIGTSATTTNFDFRVRGDVPNLNIDATVNNKQVVLPAQINLRGDLNIPLGTVFNMNGFVALVLGSNINNNGYINGTIAGSNMVFFGTTGIQNYNGTGLDTLQSLSNQNTLGGIAINKPIVLYRANFFSTTSVLNSTNITMGNGATQAVTIQYGVADFTSTAGNFDVLPAFNLGTGVYSLVYAQEGSARTTRGEVPLSRSIGNLTIGNPNGVVLAGGNLTLTGTLTLTNGLLISSDTAMLVIANTAAAAAPVGSATSYVRGPMIRRLPASLVAASTYSFPIGAANYNLIQLINPGTNAGGTVDIKVRRVDTASTGTPDGTTLSTLSAGYWAINIDAGVANLDSSSIRITQAGLVGTNRIGYSTTVAGTYSGISGGPGLGIITSSNRVGSANIEGNYLIGEVIVPLSGTFLVGASKVAPNYTTITAFLNDVAGKQVQGDITVLLDADYNSVSETYPLTFANFANNNPNWTVTIKPNTGVNASIVGNNATALIRFTNQSRNYIFDGSNNGTNSRNLFINNTNTSGSVVMFEGTAANQGVRNSQLINTIIKAGSISTGFGIIVGGTAVSLSSNGIGHDNITIQNNIVYNANHGIVLSGTSSTNTIKKVNIISNIVGTDTVANYIQSNGIYLIHADSVKINKNRIYNIRTAGAINNAGISINDNVTNSTISNNIISKIYSTSTGGYGAYGINFATATGINNDSVYNNAIFELITSNYSTTSTQWNAFGVRLNGGNNIKIYNNTINLFGQPTGGTAASASAAILVLNATYTGLDIRNNILRNSMTGAIAGSKHYTFWSTLTSVPPGTISNFNNFRAVGVHGTLMNNNGTDVTTLVGLQTATTSNANSVDKDPSFVNDTTLITGLGAVKGLGTPISTITTDILDTLRANPPTIGAYETAVDLSGPTIAYTNISNTFLLTNRTLTGFASITDGTGVNTTSGTRPRLYYKKSTDANAFGTYPADNNSAFNGWKYAEASNATTPFTFTIDNSLLFSTGAVSLADTIQYFVAAQDTTSSAFVSANPSAGFAATNINTITAAPSTPNRYVIVDGPLAGSYLVGTGQSAPNFATLTSAIAALNARGVSASVEFQLTNTTYSALTETFPLVINTINGGSMANTLTIRPTLANTSISGSSATAIFTLNNASNVIIDGAISGTSRDLTITNTNTTAGTAVIWNRSNGLGLGSSRNTFKNCRLFNGSTTVANFGICVGGSTIGSSGADNDFISIENDTIASAATGIYAIGTTATSTGGLDSLVLTQNVVNFNGSVVCVGIQVGNALNAMVSRNSIDIQTSSGSSPVGISAETGFLNSILTRNNITRVTSGTGGWAGRGITIASGSATSNITVSNNFISGINGSNWNAFGNSSTMGIGIGVLGTSSTLTTVTGGVNLYYNTVNIYGSMATGSTTANTTALYVGAAATDLNIRNNIFVNTQTATNATQSNYAIYSAAPSTAFTAINYNNYYVFNSFNAASAKIGFLGTDQVLLTDWRIASAKDVNSITDSASFVSASDLHLTGTSIGNGAYTAIPIVGFTTDIDGETRNSIYPYMGADENIGAPLPVTFTSFAAKVQSKDAELTWTTSSEINNIGFEVERSIDGRTFEKAAFVRGVGNSNKLVRYNMTDAYAFNKANVLYYRLKQVDFDGKYAYSQVLRLSISSEKANSIVVYPNPFSTEYQVSFQANNEGIAILETVDLQGKVVANKTVSIQAGINAIPVTEVDNLKAGVYFVRLTVNGETQVMKLVKN
jgi:hypothetical protein